MTATVALGADEVRAEVREWLAENWSRDLTVREWWRRLADARLTAPAWPEPYGRGYPAALARIVTEELARAQVIAPPAGAVALRLAGPTILDHGTPAQQERYLPPMLRGEESWCQLFSEPGAGSDLPSLATRAVRDGDEFVVNGQKVWNSGADVARRGLLLARTSFGVPKRQGISYFVVDMDQPGIVARPLRQMNGQASFCEVFITDARVRVADLLGKLDDGWTVARTTLGHERVNAAERLARGLVFVASGEKAGQLDRRTGDVVDAPRGPRGRFTGSAVPARHLIELARERGLVTDAVMRQRLAHYYVLTEVHRLTQRRARDAARAGMRPGPEGSISKLVLGDICRASRDLSFAILGADTMLSGADAPYDGELQTVGLGSPGVTIGAGTDEIQRNTIGERILGLPRGPEEK
ncbi:MAG TPA: acyl-CoA dehydrogenase family protein [Acidimicrobiia bacterium]|nr:acyl-CoA dehydrogenase family protein [Acidimicrobiia bacterium]